MPPFYIRVSEEKNIYVSVFEKKRYRKDKSRTEAGSLQQRSPAFLAPGTSFMEDNFPTDGRASGGCRGWGSGPGGNASNGERQMKPRSPVLQSMGGSRVEEMRVVGNDIPTFFLYSFDFGNNFHVFYTYL